VKNIFLRFLHNRRGAVAVIFAIALLPLVMLIGLSIDYSFYVQARSQFALASDASATYAIREATAAYSLGGYNSQTAEAAGDVAGVAWFNSQLATLPTATIQGGSPSVTVLSNQNLSSTNPAGFQATVTYTGLYPPFFNGLFNRTSKWTVSGSSQANSQYSYVEVLLLLDTSGSMLVSADQGNNSAVSSLNPGGILTMDDNTVCIPNKYLTDTSGISGIGAYSDPSHIVTWADVQNLASPTDTGLNAQCARGMNEPYSGANASPGGAFAPCAFACHTTTSTYNAPGFTYSGGLLATTNSGTYTGDLYGLARKLGVLLKTDVVFQSTENIINTMINSNQAPKQFSVGVYSFNDDVCPIVKGGSGDMLPEATSNLSTALSEVQDVDYTHNPTETLYPPITPYEQNDFTNFPLSVSDLIAGKFGCDSAGGNVQQSTGTPLQAAAPAGITPGDTGQYPEKDIFIVTDGMEDSGTASSIEPRSASCGRTIGEMTSIAGETSNGVADCSTNAGIPAPVCKQLKNLGFTVYVLDVSYPAVEVQFYYTPGAYGSEKSDYYLNYDFPSLGNTGGQNNVVGSTQVWNEGISTTSSGGSTTLTIPSPNQQALQACASSPSDFYQASSSTAIQTAMSQMLKSALDSAIRITQ
jgi:Flp pilus assembly protein TadG